MEIGYIQAPHQTLPVVFDSPRNRGLKEFPIKCVLVGAGGAVGPGPPCLEVSFLVAALPTPRRRVWPPRRRSHLSTDQAGDC